MDAPEIAPAEKEKKRKPWKQAPDKTSTAYRFRIYPTESQKHQMARTFGCKRYVYNHLLDIRQNEWKANRHGITYKESSRILTDMKHRKETDWLNRVDSMALQESLRDLDHAFKNFFKKLARYPRKKSKKSFAQSYRTRNQTGNIRIVGKEIWLPKLGAVKIKQHRTFSGRILHATVVRTADDKYFVSLCVEMDKSAYFQDLKNTKKIGIDVGLKSFYADSEGNVIENPKIFDKLHKRLKKEQQKLARTNKKSANHRKQRIKVARAYARICNKRNDFLHKQTYYLATHYGIVAVEHLRIKGMLKNSKLSKAISTVAWGEFFRQLGYKMPKYGGRLLRVGTTYPSSQICHVCGYKNPLVKDLNVREWVCSKCHAHHDRDFNAAKNILSHALEIDARASS